MILYFYIPNTIYFIVTWLKSIELTINDDKDLELPDLDLEDVVRSDEGENVLNKEKFIFTEGKGIDIYKTESERMAELWAKSHKTMFEKLHIESYLNSLTTLYSSWDIFPS